MPWQLLTVHDSGAVQARAPWGAHALCAGPVSELLSRQVRDGHCIQLACPIGQPPWCALHTAVLLTLQVWGVVDKALVPLVRIGDRVAPAARLIVSEPLGLLITAHNGGLGVAMV